MLSQYTVAALLGISLVEVSRRRRQNKFVTFVDAGGVLVFPTIQFAQIDIESAAWHVDTALVDRWCAAGKPGRAGWAEFMAG